MALLGVDIGGTRVKCAVGEAGGAWSVCASSVYDRPDAGAIARSVAETVERLDRSVHEVGAVGVCLPGVYDPDRRAVVRSVNLPGLEGVPIDRLLPESVRALARFGDEFRCRVVSDARAAAEDWVRTHGRTGRVLSLSLGTGVGACVLDDGCPLRVSGDSPGHFGQIDVSIETEADRRPVGPDGGRGGLEAYIGARALAARLGTNPAEWIGRLRVDSAPLEALARAIRVGHAIYRPDRVVLLGGVGLALRPLLHDLDARVRDGLTGLARPGWRLEVGDDEFHAARGAAQLAAGDAGF